MVVGQGIARTVQVCSEQMFKRYKNPNTRCMEEVRQCQSDIGMAMP